MDFKTKLVAVIVAVLALFGIYADSGVNVGSVARAGEYQSTTTVATGAVVNTSRLIADTNGVLGSVIISSTTNATFVIKNASSTTDVSSTTVATFAASAANGTYTFDSILTRGLILEIPAGFAGSYTITYR